MATLRNELIPLSSYRETSKSLIKDLLRSRTGTKVVVLDPSLYKIFQYGGFAQDIFGTSTEKASADILDKCEISDTVNAKAKANNIIYIVRPTMENLKTIREHIEAYRTVAPNSTVFVNFCPKTMMAEHVLLNEYKLADRLGASLVVDKLELDLFPLEDDVLSMEMPTDYRELFLNGDVTLLHSVAQSIVEMQAARFGPIKTIKAKGKFAKKVVGILERLQNEAGQETLMERPATVESMLIIDRSVDLVTPLLTQLTYEGLIDELYGIEAAVFKPPFEAQPEEATSNPNNPNKLPGGNIPLHNGDPIFQELRDCNFTTVGGVLRNRSVEIKQSYERRKEAQDLKDIKEFMRALPETQERHRLVGVHTNIATQIGKTTQNPAFRDRITIEQTIIKQEDGKVAEYIEDLINKGEDVRRVLRLMCLFSIVYGGIKPKTYDTLKEALLLSYGIPQMVAALYSLEQAGLILRNDGRSGVYAGIRKASRLWVDGLDEKKQSDTAYTYSGYCPLIARVAEAMLQNVPINTNTAAAATGGGGLAAVGGMFDLGATLAVGAIGGNTNNANTQEDTATLVKEAVQGAGPSRITLVYIVGGVTYAELSALRHVAKQLSQASAEQRNFVFVTTSITNGSKLMNNLLPFLPK